MADENDNGEDPTLELPPVTRQRSKPAPAPAPTGVETLAQVLAKALGEATGAPKVEVRYGENDKSEVWLKANRRFNVDAADLAWSQIAGSAHGMDGMGRHIEPNELFAVRALKAEWLIENGYARIAKEKLA